MAQVLIACPTTGDLVPTGIDADDLDELITIHMLVRCLACGGDHIWRANEAVLAAA